MSKKGNPVFDESQSRFIVGKILVGLCLTFAFSCSIPFPELDELGLLMLAQTRLNPGSCSTDCTSETGDTGSGNGASSENTRKYIFVTQGTSNGNLGGVSGADTICQNEKNNNFASLPGVGTDYRALIVDDTNRRACANGNPNCVTTAGNNINWVLQPNTEYFRSTPTEVSLFTTNAAGIFVFGNLSNPFNNTASDKWWTGLDSDWRSAGDRCLNWSDLSSLEQGSYGSGNVTNGVAIVDAFGDDCDQSLRLLCVRN
ncbi:DUF1554 domain-containing protein [Leptospira sp. GIMC2001]|uniref:DUF1554 domain-containing protein n=1 Tax=Leptospira sp. GIMC2001 TaxID=1513297 RepID=UPI00234BADDC|nr:DUF1554 domain-containing protein [Leptospira sp. GIMC2001]WCL50085.1 DUF1554 domain-containing protein [Leptospira sp. GIMC2001]